MINRHAAAAAVNRKADERYDSAAWFSPMFSQALDARLLVDLDGLLLDINAAGTALLGFGREELTGRSLCDLYQPGHEEETALQIEQMRTSPVYRVECVLIAKEGGERNLEATSSRLVVRDDWAVLLVELRDLRGLRAMHQELHESRMLFTEAQKLVKMGSWSFYPLENRIVWSDEVFRIAGFAREEGEPDFETYLARIHPEDAPVFLNAVQRALQMGEAYVVKHRFQMPDGGTSWVVASGSAVYDDQGQLTRLIGTIQDITEQVGSLQVIQSSELRLRFHIEQSPVAYIEWDMDFNVVEWNPAAERIFGFARVEALGALPDIIPEDEKAKVGALIASLLKGEGGRYSVNRNQTRQGKSITCEWFNTSLRSQGGQIVGISSIVQDITQRIEAEQALMDYARELKAARDVAESATGAKSAFLANMSHEIRTPLNGVIGMASLLQETELSSEQNDYVSTILISSESLLGIINDVLDFSKIEAGKIEMEHLPVHLDDLVEGSLDLLATRAAEQGLELLYEMAEGVPRRIYTDPTRLRQILVNLLSNGVKFTERGEIEVHVSAEAQSDGRYKIHFAVRDTGIGIPIEKLDRLFRSFTQVDASTTRKYGGTGLGLSISHKLAELMGGTMWVESKEGEGTTFHFTVMADAMAGDSGDTERAFPVAHHLLLIEPHERSRAMLSRRLAAMNMVVESCASVAEALPWILDRAFEAVIIDIRLDPSEAGAFCAAIAANGVHLPVLALLSLGGDGSSRALPADAVVHRPVRSQSLFSKLQEAFAAKPFAHPSVAAGLSMDQARVFLAEKHPLHQRLVLKMLVDLGCAVEIGTPADALARVAEVGWGLVFVTIDEIERVVAARPALRFNTHKTHVVALAMRLSAVRRSALRAIGVADILQLPIQAGALQRVMQRYLRTRSAANASPSMAAG